MGVEYVDIFYSHRADPETPVEETMGALDHAVRSGKALYVGISSYDADQTAKAVKILRELGTPCLIHQPRYSLLERTPEHGLFDVLGNEGVGTIAFCPLAQGLLTDRYLDGIPQGSRASKPYSYLKKEQVSTPVVAKVRAWNEIAAARGQSLAQMSLAWVLRDSRVTSALIGASRVEQIEQNVAALGNLAFTKDELTKIDAVAAQG
jgi:L-glyceraldehyde 3-phosphate reductase